MQVILDSRIFSKSNQDTFNGNISMPTHTNDGDQKVQPHCHERLVQNKCGKGKNMILSKKAQSK